jgi:hypothetical protein
MMPITLSPPPPLRFLGLERLVVDRRLGLVRRRVVVERFVVE